MFPQPLAAMRRVLDGSHPLNDGFVRPDAVLAIVFLTGSDDCSARGDALFDPELAHAVGGPEFRCFQFGVECSGDDVWVPGQRQGCAPRVDSPYMRSVADYVTFLRDLKLSPDDVIVTGIMGDPSLVEISVSVDGAPQLVPACGESGAGAEPAVRLQGLLDGLDRGTEFRSICDGVPNAVLDTAQQIRRALGTVCLERELQDRDARRAGLQPECRVFDLDTADRRTDLPMCDDWYDVRASTNAPCYAFKTGLAECSSYPTQLGIQLWRGPGVAQPDDTHVIVECVVND